MGKQNKEMSPKALLELPSNLQLPPAVTHGADHASSSNVEQVKCSKHTTDEKAPLVVCFSWFGELLGLTATEEGYEHDR